MKVVYKHRRKCQHTAPKLPFNRKSFALLANLYVCYSHIYHTCCEGRKEAEHAGDAHWISKSYVLDDSIYNLGSIFIVNFDIDLMIWVVEKLIYINTFVPTFSGITFTIDLQFEAAASIIAARCPAVATYLLH